MIAGQQDLERSGPHLFLQHRWGAHQASGPSGSVQTAPIIINGFSSCMVFVVVFVRSGSRCAAKWSFIHSWQTWQSHVGREGWGARPLVLENLTSGLPLLSGGPLCCFVFVCFACMLLRVSHAFHASWFPRHCRHALIGRSCVCVRRSACLVFALRWSGLLWKCGDGIGVAKS